MEKIAALQARYNGSKPFGQPTPAAEPAAPESTGAKLHRQPTTPSVAGADAAADSEAARKSPHFPVKIEEARAAEHSGDWRGCEAAGDAATALSP